MLIGFMTNFGFVSEWTKTYYYTKYKQGTILHPTGSSLFTIVNISDEMGYGLGDIRAERPGSKKGRKD